MISARVKSAKAQLQTLTHITHIIWTISQTKNRKTPILTPIFTWEYVIKQKEKVQGSRKHPLSFLFLLFTFNLVFNYDLNLSHGAKSISQSPAQLF
jgi:hypothetical protein